MSDIFREVDEALQHDKMLKIWEEYRATIIAAIAILIVSTAATNFYHSWDNKRNAAETQRLSQALQADDPQAAIQDVIQDTRKGHKALGLMSAANLHLKNNKKEDAAALFQDIATNKKSPRNIRDLARILYVQTANQSNIDILKPLLKNKKSPWIWHARIEAAVITAHSEENYTQALDYLAPFESTEYVPASLRQRAEALAHVYSLKVEKQKMATETAEKETEKDSGDKK